MNTIGRINRYIGVGVMIASLIGLVFTFFY
jgi:hypothetical protein